MRSLKKVLIHCSSIIQHQSDSGQIVSNLSQSQQKDRENVIIDNIKKLAKLIQHPPPMQYRDLIHACEDKFFARVLEAKATKGDTGIVLLADLLISFNLPQQA